MIIPWLKGILTLQQIPITWAIVFTNVFIYLLTFQPGAGELKTFHKNEYELRFTGELYRQFLFSSGKIQLTDDLLLLGGMAMKDNHFVDNFVNFKFNGDEIKIQEWKNNFSSYREQAELRNVRVFGLSPDRSDINLNWITYQFMHASVFHLLGNMFMLIIFGGALELLIGSAWIIIIYLAGGLFAAFGFIFLNSMSMTPMVGASGALTAIMSFYLVTEKKKNLQFFYFISPIQGYFGNIFMSKWLLLPLIFFPDISAYLSTPTEMGSGIAYAAHIFGAAFGFILALGIKLLRLEQSLFVKYSPLRTEAP